jgi:replicative DNA helicase
MTDGQKIQIKQSKLPPQALDLEASILGAILIDKEALNVIVDTINVKTFYSPAHQYIFEAILDLFNQNLPIDINTVVNQLRKNKKLEQVGGAIYIQSLTDNVVSSANIEYHALALLEYSIKRDLITVSNEIQRKAYDDSVDVFSLLDQSELKIFSISSNHVNKNYSDMKSVLRDTINDIDSKRKTKSFVTGIPSGFRMLDAITSGWQKSDLIIVAARPGMGKTAFMLSLVRNAAINYKIPVAMFSLEMSSVQLTYRLVSAEAELENDKIRKGLLEDYEWQQLIHKTKELSEAPIFIDDTASLSIFELKTKCRKLKMKHNIQLIIVDYLQLITSDQGGKSINNREQEIAYISRSLKSLAKELDVPTITPSQLSRAVEVRGGDKRPILSDLRESGAIEQDADIVMFLYRPEYYGINEDETGNDMRGLTEVIIAKHRNGPVDTAQIKFIGKFTKFVNF